MNSKNFVGIELNDSAGNKIIDNKIASDSDNSKGIQLNGSNNNDISGNQIISHKQLEVLDKLNNEVESLIDQTNNEQVINLLNEIKVNINEIKTADQVSQSDKVNSIVEKILNLNSLSSEVLPKIGSLLPYLYQIGSNFTN